MNKAKICASILVLVSIVAPLAIIAFFSANIDQTQEAPITPVSGKIIFTPVDAFTNFPIEDLENVTMSVISAGVYPDPSVVSSHTKVIIFVSFNCTNGAESWVPYYPSTYYFEAVEGSSVYKLTSITNGNNIEPATAEKLSNTVTFDGNWNIGNIGFYPRITYEHNVASWLK